MLPPDRHYSRRDSNPDLRFRRPTFYPLNYGSGSSSRRERIRSEPERTISRVLPVSISITKNGSAAKSTVKVSRTRIRLNISPERSIPSPIHRYRYRKITVFPVCRANGTSREHEIQKNDFGSNLGHVDQAWRTGLSSIRKTSGLSDWDRIDSDSERNGDAGRTWLRVAIGA